MTSPSLNSTVRIPPELMPPDEQCMEWFDIWEALKLAKEWLSIRRYLYGPQDQRVAGLQLNSIRARCPHLTTLVLDYHLGVTSHFLICRSCYTNNAIGKRPGWAQPYQRGVRIGSFPESAKAQNICLDLQSR